MPGERANDEQGPGATPIETDQETTKHAAEVAPSAPQGPLADAPNVALSAKPTDVARMEAATSAAKRLGDDHRTTLVKSLLDMDPDTRKSVALEVGRSLASEDQRDVASSLLPSQGVMNRIWLIIVGTFAVVFLVTAFTLCGAVLWGVSTDTQTLLTVVTTIAGILAGFISGRASTGETPS
jgi:type IV secretory pathway VirB2 component (pilin)